MARKTETFLLFASCFKLIFGPCPTTLSQGVVVEEQTPPNPGSVLTSPVCTTRSAHTTKTVKITDFFIKTTQRAPIFLHEARGVGPGQVFDPLEVAWIGQKLMISVPDPPPPPPTPPPQAKAAKLLSD